MQVSATAWLPAIVCLRYARGMKLHLTMILVVLLTSGCATLPGVELEREAGTAGQKPTYLDIALAIQDFQWHAPCPEPGICGRPPLREIRALKCQVLVNALVSNCRFVLPDRYTGQNQRSTCSAILSRVDRLWRITEPPNCVN